jgi:hypothetical protein
MSSTKPRHFLGKTAPGHSHLAPARASSNRGLLLLLLPVFFASLFIGTLGEGTRFAHAERQVILASLPNAPAPDPCNRIPAGQSGANTNAVNQIYSGDIFPLFPAVLFDFPDETGHVRYTGCYPALWTRDVIGALIFKILGLLNYVAGALALLTTIYAGILYLTAPISEGTVKTAKSILLGTYLGFFIVLGARLIVQGSFQLFGDSNPHGNVLELP